MKARLDRETVEEVTVTVLVKDVNAQLPSQQNATGECAVIRLGVSYSALGIASLLTSCSADIDIGKK